MIQPLVLERLPCYDFTPIIEPTFGRALLSVRLRTSGVPDSHGVTGGVYKARERIHRGMLTTITSDSDFTQAGCSLRSELGRLFGVRSASRLCIPLLTAIVLRV